MLKIIISPAKKMQVRNDFDDSITIPAFMEDAGIIRTFLQAMPVEELKKLWKCSDALATRNYGDLHTFTLENPLTKALLSYEGIQYQYMAPQVFSEAQWSYVSSHLRILSGFYGILRPTDGVIPYRLEMQAKFSIKGFDNLYEFWNERLCAELLKMEEDLVDEKIQIINLASAEYSKVILPYLENAVSCITCIFGEEMQGKIKVKGTQVKIARGEMVRFMAEHNIEKAEDLKKFDRLSFRFNKEKSSQREYVFLRT